jgi:hypothetical protein
LFDQEYTKPPQNIEAIEINQSVQDTQKYEKGEITEVVNFENSESQLSEEKSKSQSHISNFFDSRRNIVHMRKKNQEENNKE